MGIGISIFVFHVFAPTKVRIQSRGVIQCSSAKEGICIVCGQPVMCGAGLPVKSACGEEAR